MKHLLLTALVLISTQLVFAQEDWRAPNARPLVNRACEAQKSAQQILGISEQALSCSTGTSTAYASEAFDLANNLAITSAKLLEFRIVNKQNLSMDAMIHIEDLEMQIDRLVVQFRGRGTATILFE